MDITGLCPFSFSAECMSWIKAFSVLLILWMAGFFFRRVLFLYLARWSEKTSNQIDDIIILKSRLHVLFWSFLLGVYLAGQFAPVTPAARLILSRIIFSLAIVSVTLLAANVLAAVIKVYSEKISLSLPLTSLTENLIKLIIIIIGALILLAHLGISITPLLTALGVGSLAVALALQDTLSNLFAGFYIIANKQIRTGDYIKLDSGQEGYVADIGWRATRITMLSNNIILVPNAKLGSAIVTNYFLPEKEMGLVIQACVGYSSDLEKVEKVTIEVARETLKTTQGGVESFEPFIRFHTFGDSSVNFSVILRVREFVDQYLVTHEFIKRLHRRYRAEGIEIPFPQRTVRLIRE
ncbi:MAG: mechanosensitive ion channel family protein [Endomicrobiales bacterium]